MLAPGMPTVCRLGLATRGGSRLQPADVEAALARGINYLNWCGHADGLSEAIRGLGPGRRKVVIAAQYFVPKAKTPARVFESMLAELNTDHIDILTLYWVETESQWESLTAPGGAWEYLAEQKRAGRLGMIGLTSHQRNLAAKCAQTGKLDMLMIRYNAAHRGAEDDVFPVTSSLKLPVVTYTALRWRALLKRTGHDPPGFKPPSAAECYRFCLAEPRVSVVLAAPKNREELDHTLTLLDDWRTLTKQDLEAIRAHGERVRRYAGKFW